jgi:V/A-type H+/Na+-transporting ATPase subunit F
VICMYKIGIIGDADTVLAFKSLGIKTFPVEDVEQARENLRKAAQEDYAVIFLTEQMAQQMKETIKSYNNKMLPSIILIPNNEGSLGIGIENLKSSVEKAIGVDILFNKREGEEIDTGKNN